MNKYLLVGIAAILVIAGGWLYFNQSTQSSIVDTAQLPGRQNSTTGSNSNTIASRSGWVIASNQQLGIRFESPADASVSSSEQRQTIDGASITTLTITPRGTDATVVFFFTTKVSLEQAKNIQFYQSTISTSEFSEVIINGRNGVRRIDHYANNDCTNELTVVEKSGTIYGSHIVQCPTHPTGYDQLRKGIADSLKVL